MKTTICDICGRTLEPNHDNPSTINGKATLIKTEPRVEFDEATPRHFTFKVTVESYQFNCTNFHVCKRCIADAISRSVMFNPNQEVCEKK